MAWAISQEEIGKMITLVDFRQMFIMIDQEYQNLNLGDGMEDQEKIDEYSWITQQLRKYAGSHEAQLRKARTSDELLQIIEDLIDKAPEYGNNRKELVYNCLLSRMLTEWYNNVSVMYEEEGYDGE